MSAAFRMKACSTTVARLSALPNSSAKDA